MTRWQSIVAALKGGAYKSWLATALSAVLSFGFLDSEQVTLINNLVATATTLVAVVISLVHTFHAAKLQRRLVELKAGPDGVYRAA